ncbi:ATP-binding protein [Clostridium sp. C2-6-12]|uniref:sensor histidine kinase n=1 Tax=Clostridium sp. C2-6-12 TaxID=2698832 RepID=UPI001369D1E4|nr:ATP-binding protein [Clostridium sp. C2-6-12]
MALNFLDMAASILQAILIVYAINYCAHNHDKRSPIMNLFIVIIYSLEGQIFTSAFGNSWGMAVFSTHIVGIFITAIFYRKNILTAIVSYTIMYSIMMLMSIIFGSLIFEYVRGIFPKEYIFYETIFIVYVPQCILLLLCFMYISKIREVHQLIINEGFSAISIIVSFFLDFILTFYLVTLGQKSQLLKNIIYIVFFIFLVILLVYFWKIHQKSQQIYKLNEALEVKNGDLRKIKHDYGAQISYLYGLCLMERFDDLKKALKDIINNNDSVPTAVEVTGNQESLLAVALKPAIEQGIHVIIEEKCDFSLINMSEMEFFRVVSNIVNNAIKAMNGEGIIIAKSYEYLGNAIIKIENNGPKIEDRHIKDIFKEGFTTKDNAEKNHGFGLSIVKELVESRKGKVLVKSTDAATEFKIILPIDKNA